LLTLYSFPTRRSSDLYNSGPLGYGPDIKSNPRTFRLTPDEPARLVYANEGQYGAPYGSTAAAVGGGTVAYGCMSWRFVAKDFRIDRKSTRLNSSHVSN